jgi:C-terminal domain of Type VI secretion system FHA protein/FHA domain
MSITLHITKPGGDTAFDNVVRPTTDVIRLGRRPDNEIVLDDHEFQVSGAHARIENKGGSYRIIDLGSRNGTFLDERRLKPNQPAILRGGSILQIGMLQIEVLLDDSSSDLGRTIIRRDPKRSAGILGELLCGVYAEYRDASVETRTSEMRKAVDRALDGTDPSQARVVLSMVCKEFGRDESDDDGVEDLSQQEELFRSGFQTMKDLSQHLIRRSDFTSSEDVGRFVRLIQLTLDGMLSWVATALQGRAEFKEQFGAEVTQIFFKAEHNPLKSGGDGETIAEFLLDWSSSRGIGEVRSHWEQALRDLSMHQFSLLRAVQETLRQVFAQLDPEELERQAEAKSEDAGWLKKVVGGESPWEIYKGAFVQMRDEQSRFFDGVIYPTMKKGYIEGHQEYLEQSSGSTSSHEQSESE